MPNVATFYNRTDNQPASYYDIDEAICAHFNLPVDPVIWAANWYNTIAFSVAMGTSLMDIIADPDWSPQTIRIAIFLNSHYTTTTHFTRT